MYEITVEARFVATHRVRRPNGELEEPHEHDWRVRVTYAGQQLGPAGLLVDFDEARRRVDAVLAGLRGRCLNDLPAFSGTGPTAELLARFINEALSAAPGLPPPGCTEVEEAPGCFARYFPDV